MLLQYPLRHNATSLLFIPVGCSRPCCGHLSDARFRVVHRVLFGHDVRRFASSRSEFSSRTPNDTRTGTYPNTAEFHTYTNNNRLSPLSGGDACAMLGALTHIYTHGEPSNPRMNMAHDGYSGCNCLSSSRTYNF